jgi:hypothetical protein
LALPWRTIGVRPTPGEVWGLNVCRSRPQASEYGSWTGVQGSYGQPQYFGEARFPATNGLTLDNRGLAAPEGNANQRNTFTGSFRATAAGKLTVSVKSSAQKAATVQTVAVLPAVTDSREYRHLRAALPGRGRGR